MLGGFGPPRRARGALPGRRGHQRGLVPQVVEHRGEQRIPAAQVESPVEVAVGQAAVGPVGSLGRPSMIGRFAQPLRKIIAGNLGCPA